MAALRGLLSELEHDPRSAGLVDVVGIRASLGAAMRQAGDPEGAATLLGEISAVGSSGQQLQTRHALLVALIELGRLEQALAVADDAVRLAAGPYRKWAAAFNAARAALLASLSRSAEAEAALMSVPEEQLGEPHILISYASALVSHPTLVHSAEGSRMAATALEQLGGAWRKHDETHLSEAAEQALRLMALLARRIGSQDEMQLWRILADLSEASGRPDPMASIALVTEPQSPESVRAAVDRAFGTLAAAFSGTRQLSESYLSTHSLWGFFDSVQRTLAENGMPPEYKRVVAELGRDVIGRLRPLDSAPASSAMAGKARAAAPWDNVVAGLPAQLTVVEWIPSETDTLLPLITVLGAPGVRTYIATSPPVDIARLGKRISARVGGWYAGRKGDPFDLLEWQTASRWLSDIISAAGEDIGTVVLIDHPVASRTPWHVALTPRWPVCSVPSWAPLLAETSKPPGAAARIGCMIVPRFGEDQEVLQAFDRVRAGLTDLSERMPRAALEIAEGINADHEEFRRLLGGTDLCVVLCHGYAPANEPGVAWLLADSAVLPLRGSVEAASEMGRRHQFTWRDCDALEAASPVIVSAACSTASAHFAGAGEQLGLYSALRRHGTRALIAPRWEIPASAVLPVFSDVVRQIAAEGQSPASAVRNASLKAAEHLPPWLAYAPAVAGGW